MITKKYLTAIFISSLLVSCSASKVPDSGADENQIKNFYGEYCVYEKFEVRAGALTGQRGTTKYNITILPGEKENEFIIENFAKSFKVNASVRGDSILIPSQKFPYHRDKMTIYGNGKLVPDSLSYRYFSGGPGGQIYCECKAAKK